jgi:flagellar motor switch/type III secretory pathway protein FliN
MADVEMEVEGLVALRTCNVEVNRLAALLCQLVSAAGLQVSVLQDASDHGQWFTCGTKVAFRIRSIDGRHVADAGDAAGAVAMLDKVDPLLVRIESALGIDLEATGFGEPADLASVVLDISDGAARICVAIQHDDAQTADWVTAAAALRPDDAQMPAVFSLDMTGPRLSVAEASSLSAGDLILIGQMARAQIHGVGSWQASGTFDMVQGQFTTAIEGGTMAGSDADAFGTVADFAVPLTIRLPERMTSAATLAALRPGMMLPLGPLTDGMPVTLLVADRPLARGELVQLGDRFAVLIEDRAALADPLQEAQVVTGDPS